MCTLIAKVAKNAVSILDGSCCMRVEDLSVLCPKLCKKNAWKEYGIGSYPIETTTINKMTKT